MSDKNNIYNILNTLNFLEPKQEEIKEVAPTTQKKTSLLESKMEEVLAEKLNEFKALKDIGNKFAKLLDPDAKVKAKNMTPDQIKALQQAKKDPSMLNKHRDVYENHGEEIQNFAAQLYRKMLQIDSGSVESYMKKIPNAKKNLDLILEIEAEGILDSYEDEGIGTSDMNNFARSILKTEIYPALRKADKETYDNDYADETGENHDKNLYLESESKLLDIINKHPKDVAIFYKSNANEMSPELESDLHNYYLSRGQLAHNTDDYHEELSDLFYNDLKDNGIINEVDDETLKSYQDKATSTKDIFGNPKKSYLNRIQGLGRASEKLNKDKNKEEVDESGLQYYTGKKKYGKDGMDALAKAGREGASQEELGRIKDKFIKKEEVDMGQYDARKTTPSSEKDKEDVFAKHRERMKNLDKENKKEVKEATTSYIDQIRDIVNNKQAKRIKFPDGSTLVDGFTASAIIQVYDAVNDQNKEKIANKLTSIAGLKKVASIAFQLMNESTDVTNYNPKSQGGTRKELLAKLKKTKDSKDATAARKAGATQKELQDAMKESKKAKNPYAIGMAQAMKSTGDKPPLKKSTIKKAHEIAKKVDEGRRFTELPPDDPESFANYILEFYGPNGVYPMGATREQVLKAIKIYLNPNLWAGGSKPDMAYDSVDRENIRDILISQFGLKFPSARGNYNESITDRMVESVYREEEKDDKDDKEDEPKSYEQDLKDRNSENEEEITKDNLEESTMDKDIKEMMRLAGVKVDESRMDIGAIQSAQKHSKENPSKKDTESDKNIDKPYGYRDSSAKSDDEKELDEGSMDLNLIKAAQKHSEENPSKKDAESDRNIDKPYGYRDSQSKKDDEELDEAEMEEGWNKFTGALEKAKDAGKDSFEFDGKTYQVKESDEDDIQEPRNPQELDYQEGPEDDEQYRKHHGLDEMRKLAGLNECGDMSPVGSMEQQGRMNVSTNMSSDGTKSVTVTADGDAAVALMQMLTLAGMEGQGVQMSSPENEQMEKVEEVMGNTPDPEVMPVQMLTKGGDGEVAGKEKQMTKGGYKFSDNPLREGEVEVDIPGTKGASDQERHAAIMKKYPNAKKVGKTPGAYSTTGKGKADLVSGIQGVRKISEEDSMFSGRFLKEYESIKAKTK